VDEVIHHLEDAGFTNFTFVETIFHDLDEILEIEPIHEGYGEGSFMVVKGIKSSNYLKEYYWKKNMGGCPMTHPIFSVFGWLIH
jgi:hypothetical protein